MDIHHKVNYGLAAAALSASAGLYSIFPAPKPSWPVVKIEQAEQIAKAVAAVIGNKPIMVYCLDSECRKIEKTFMSGGKFKTDHVWYLPDGVSVGAPTQAEADKIAKAVEDATAGALKPDAVPGQRDYYIGFGRFVEN